MYSFRTAGLGRGILGLGRGGLERGGRRGATNRGNSGARYTPDAKVRAANSLSQSRRSCQCRNPRCLTPAQHLNKWFSTFENELQALYGDMVEVMPETAKIDFKDFVVFAYENATDINIYDGDRHRNGYDQNQYDDE